MPIRPSCLSSRRIRAARYSRLVNPRRIGHAAAPQAHASALPTRSASVADARTRGLPLRARLPALAVRVVVVPPLIWRRLRVALRRVLPLLLAPERGDVEVAPRAPHLLVATAVDEVGAVDLAVVADERGGSVPLTDAEV